VKTTLQIGIAGLLLAACSDAIPPSEPAPFETLVTGDWELPAGVEGYRCVYLTTSERMSVDALEAIAPPGTHHTLLGIASEYDGEDGLVPCTAADFGETLLFGTGVGTDRLELPEGTAVVIEAGTRLVLNLHLVNATGATLSGTSGIRVRHVEPSLVEEELESVMAGPTEFEIPANSLATVEGTCTFQEAGGVIALMPHMHTLGRSLYVAVDRADGSTEVLHDAPYDFELQSYDLFDSPVLVEAGDKLHVRCDFENTTSEPVTFGQSTYDEMCFAAVFRYPRTGASVICDDALENQ
jgi:hypothetical protein